MTANSSLFGSVCSLVPVQVAQRDPGDSPFQDLQDWHAVPSQGSRPAGSVSLEAPVAFQREQWSGSTLAKLCLTTPSSRTRSMWLKSSLGLSSSSLAIRRSTSPRSGDLLSLMRMKTWAQKSGSPRMAVGSNTSLIMAPWTNGRPYTCKSHGVVSSLIILTSKSYFPVQNKIAEKTPLTWLPRGMICKVIHVHSGQGVNQNVFLNPSTKNKSWVSKGMEKA